MTIYNRFRISGHQFKLIREILDQKSENNSVCVGICGQGEFNILNQRRQSYSLTNYFKLIEKNSLSGFISNFKGTAQSIVSFHLDMFGERSPLLDQDRILWETNKLTNKSMGLLSCFLANDNNCIAYIFDGTKYIQTDVSCVVGDDLKLVFKADNPDISDQNIRTAQAFGKGTVNQLTNLAIGIVGISGTGSIVAEQLYRLGIKELVLVDDDSIEEKNLNRILNSTTKDSENSVNKAEMMGLAIQNSGLPTKVIALPTVIAKPQTIRCLSQCDIIFGCMDSVDGRHQLNRLCAFYSIPYFDVGVKLKADGFGNVSEVTGAVHYLKPDGSSLLSRGVYNTKMLEAASLLRSNPEEYRARLQEKYIIGAKENSPAVISVNMLTASMAVNDLIARLHPYRSEPNNQIETIRIDLTEPRFKITQPTKECNILSGLIGIGDQKPLLRMPILSEVYPIGA